jgi:DNA modification methylase/sporulation protein YlmC with PRC-barrel domain
MSKKAKLSDLIADNKNFNKGTEYGQSLIEKSLRKFGAGRSILIDKNNRIIAGNKTVENAAAIGLDDLQIVESDGTKIIAVKRTDIDLDSKAGRELALADNATSKANIDWDIETTFEVANEFGFDAGEWGVEDSTKEIEAVEDDFNETPPEIPITVLGDLYEIGEHRLLCGDSTDSDQVAKLMNGSKADMVFTDPPYGIDYSGGRTQVVKNKTYGKLMNDDLQGVELGELISNVFQFNKQEADVYICVSPKMQKPFLDFIEANNKEIDAVIVWDKKQAGLGYMAYRRQCEFILFVKGGAFKKGDNSDFDLWSISRDNGQDYQHGTQKPIAVPSRAINNSSKKDDLVLDYFLGSGSTMVASHQLKRKCYGMELDPKYCDVIVRRMLRLDPTLTVKRNGVDCKDDFLETAN